MLNLSERYELQSYGSAEKVAYIGNIIIAIIGIICLLSGCYDVRPALAETIPQSQAVRAIIGEASSQGYKGLLAVACALRNRGTLRGVYGLKAKHVDKEPRWVWVLARRAWAESASRDITGGATHWENIKAFGRPYWVKSMVLTITIGDHNFYKERR